MSKMQLPIRGAFYPDEEYVFDYLGDMPYTPPNYCEDCGAPFPWTERRIEKVKKLIRSLDELSDRDRELLEDFIPQLIRQEPGYEIVARRVKQIVDKLKQPTKEFVINTITSIGGEVIKKLILGG